MKKNVCVIGAGLSGITTTKQLLDEGHQVTCYENADSHGGVFSRNKIYENLHLTISNYFMAFSDFVPSDERLKFWSKKEYFAYLKSYIDKFSLNDNFRFSTEVKSVMKHSSGEGWNVTVKNEEGETTTHFDAVAICSGHFQTPKIPDFKGADEFQGIIIHSQDYRDKENYRGKKVMCIGLGESSSDITSEVSSTADKCILSLRRYQAVAPRYMAFQEDTYFTIDTSWLTSRVVNRLPKSFHHNAAKKIFKKYRKSHNPDVKIRGNWLLESGSPVNQAVTKNERIFKPIADGKVTPNIGGIDRFDKKGVFFKDGTYQELDAVICCTGYQLEFPFLDFPIKDMRDLYKQIFISDIGESLSFIGFVRPQQGGIPVIAEMQARYLSLLLSGKKSLPDMATQKEVIRRDTDHWRKEYYITPDVPSLVNYCHYMDSMAQLVGCLPETPTLVSDPKLRVKLLHGPQFAAQYRLNGPHSKPEEAKKFLLSFPDITTRKKIITHEFWLAFCSVLNRFPKWRLRSLQV
ncbi:MAG: NAD(P)-binding domain-containing protein [Cyclobacteriaceae bacterium]